MNLPCIQIWRRSVLSQAKYEQDVRAAVPAGFCIQAADILEVMSGCFECDVRLC